MHWAIPGLDTELGEAWYSRDDVPQAERPAYAVIAQYEFLAAAADMEPGDVALELAAEVAYAEIERVVYGRDTPVSPTAPSATPRPNRHTRARAPRSRTARAHRAGGDRGGADGDGEPPGEPEDPGPNPTPQVAQAVADRIADHGLTLDDYLAHGIRVVGERLRIPYLVAHRQVGTWQTVDCRTGEKRFADGATVGVFVAGDPHADRLVVVEAPEKAIAVQVATGVTAVAGNGAWGLVRRDGRRHALLPAATAVLGDLRGRHVTLLPDADYADGHTDVRRAIHTTARVLRDLATDVTIAQHRRCSCHAAGKDANDLLRDHGPDVLAHLLATAKWVGGGDDEWTTPLSEVQPEPIRWLWRGRIAAGKVTLLDGDPGVGKSTLAADIAARLTAGRKMPYEDREARSPGKVLLMQAEDGLADTVCPRYGAADADLSRVHTLSVSADLPSLPQDLARIRDRIVDLDVELVVVDPLMAFLGGEVDSHRDQDVRRVMAPLARIAEQTGVAMLVLRHLVKSTDRAALYRGGGSIGIVAAARVGLLVAPDPDDPGVRVLAPVKCNVGPPPSSLRYRLIPAQSNPGVAVIEWLGEDSRTADQVLGAGARARQPPVDLRAAFVAAVRGATVLMTRSELIGSVHGGSATRRRATLGEMLADGTLREVEDTRRTADGKARLVRVVVLPSAAPPPVTLIVETDTQSAPADDDSPLAEGAVVGSTQEEGA